MTPGSVLPVSDALLMERVQAGERIALGELYDRFAVRAYRTAFSVCGDRESAEDAVHDAFVSLWSSRGTYEPARGTVLAWTMTIVHRRAIDLVRVRAAARSRDGGVDRLEQQPARDDVHADLAERTEGHELRGLLDQLPAAQSEVIRLGFFGGLSHREIAAELALPPGTVKGRMRLGLTRLRSELGGDRS